MFIYERNGALCVTFKDNKPVEAPEYVIVIDESSKSVIVNGKVFSECAEIEPVAAPVEQEASAPMTRRTTKKSEPEVVAEDPVEVTEE